jgi:hypothetical protein
MDTLKTKRFLNFGYIARGSGVTIYYDTLKERDITGIGKDLSKDTPYFTYEVKDRDTLDSIALKYYNNPTFWWIIAMFNDIQDAFIDNLKARYPILQIPNIATLVFVKEKR